VLFGRGLARTRHTTNSLEGEHLIVPEGVGSLLLSRVVLVSHRVSGQPVQLSLHVAVGALLCQEEARDDLRTCGVCAGQSNLMIIVA